MSMTYKQAHKLIEALLASVPDDALPAPGKVEQDGDTAVAWFGGTGFHLGSARRRTNGKDWERDPLAHRRDAARGALEREAVYRLDLKHEGDTK